MKLKTAQTYFFYGLLAFTAILAALIIKPFIGSLVAGFVFAIVFHPLHRRLENLKIGRTISAFIVLVFALIVIFLPLFFLGKQVFHESKTLYVSLRDGESVSRFTVAASSVIEKYLPEKGTKIAYGEIESFMSRVTSGVVARLGAIVATILGTTLNAFIAFMAFFYFLRDGRKLKNLLLKILPLPLEKNKELLTAMFRAANSIVRGSLTIGVIQGFLTGLGFYIFGLPNAALWGCVAVLASFIPGVGTSLVIIPGIAYVLLFGDLLNAIGFALWGATAVGLIDNILGPYLIRRGVNAHQFLILLSVLGGFSVFGPAGFLIGPLVLSFLAALFSVYSSGMFYEKTRSLPKIANREKKR